LKASSSTVSPSASRSRGAAADYAPPAETGSSRRP
jgi:hypothetical protein